MEIERKFLVNIDNNHHKECSHKKIIQAYLSFNPEIRIRSLGKQYFLTIKSEGDLERNEYEISITKKEFDKQLLLCKNRIIYKTRYYIPLSSSLVAEYDVYEGKLEGLATVEVEFQDVESATQFIVPDWFGKEVTYDKKFKNKNLVQWENGVDTLTS